MIVQQGAHQANLAQCLWKHYIPGLGHNQSPRAIASPPSQLGGAWGFSVSQGRESGLGNKYRGAHTPRSSRGDCSEVSSLNSAHLENGNNTSASLPGLFPAPEEVIPGKLSTGAGHRHVHPQGYQNGWFDVVFKCLFSHAPVICLHEHSSLEATWESRV